MGLGHKNKDFEVIITYTNNLKSQNGNHPLKSYIGKTNLGLCLIHISVHSMSEANDACY